MSAAPAAAPSAEPQTVAPGFEPLADAFRKLATRGRRGGALVLLRGDEVLADVHDGWADPRMHRRFTPDTATLGFSATKGLAATVLHRLADRGLLDLDAPVASYWPEFGVRRKARLTAADVLAHRAALHDVRAVAKRADDLLDHEGMEDRLAAATTAWRPGPPAYHALTYGWLTSGIARRVTGKGMRRLVEEEIAGPLDARLAIGRPEGEAPAAVLGSSLRIFTLASTVTLPLWGRLPQTKAPVRALHAPGFEALIRGVEPRIWGTEMPAANGAVTARGLARLYAPLANGGSVGGRRYLSPRTLHRLGRVQSRGTDRVLGVPMRWRLGFHQAFGLGEGSARAFGHYGFGGCGGWADPDTGLSLGYVTNDIGTVTTPIGDLGLLRLSGLARRCAADAGVPGA